MKVVVDENLPAALARALHRLCEGDGHVVAHSSEIAPRGTTDVDLFKALSEQGFRVHVTQDNHNRKQIERKAIAEAGLVVFVLSKSWSSQKFWNKAAQLVRHWPSILAQAERMNPPAAFRVTWQGKFDQLKL